MNKETQQQLNALEARQNDLRLAMAKSDAHAAKCSKLGLSFAETYPDELEEYQAANAEFNENESIIAEVREQLAAEQAAAEEAPVDEI